MSLSLKALSKFMGVTAGLCGLALLAAAQGPGWQVAIHQEPSFSASQIECADVYSTQGYSRVSWEVGSEDELLVPNKTQGEIIYLRGGEGLQPGESMRLMRVESSVPHTDQFPGQTAYLNGMGRLFAMVGRAQVLGINAAGVATARIELSCRESRRGDFAIAWQPRVSPKLEPSETIDLLHPVEGRLQMVAAGRDLGNEFARGDEIFLTGRGVATAVGQRWLIFRRAHSPSMAIFRRAAYGVEAEDAAAGEPAKIVGEAVIISARPNSSAALITYSRDMILPGDEAMLEQ